MKIAKIVVSLALLTAIPSSAFSAAPTPIGDQFVRCYMPLPAPLNFFAPFIPCWAFAEAG